MSKKVQMSPRLSPGVGEWYEQHFPSRNAGGEYVLAAWPNLYRRTLFELKGKFDRPELMLIIDVFNSTMLSPEMAGQELDLQVREGIYLDALDLKWKIDDRLNLIQRVVDLPIFSRAVLTLWANGYWYGRPDTSDLPDLPDLEKYVKAML